MLTEEMKKKFFLEKDGTVIFTGNELECYIPERYIKANYLHIGETISALGIFAMRINDEVDCGIQLPAIIEIAHSDLYEKTIDDQLFKVCVLKKNDRFMISTKVMQVEEIGYFIWREFLSGGRLPSFITYEDIATLFDDLGEIAGRGMAGNHGVLEVILSHIFRDSKDLTVKYRHTNMKEPPARVTLRDVSYGPSSTSSRILGSYSELGLNSALVNQSAENHEIEDLFRS